MEPKLIDLPEKKIVGLGTKFISILSPDRTNDEVLPRLWNEFIQRIGEIKNRKGMAAFGVCEPLPQGTASQPGEMFYIACAEVTDFATPPAGMIMRVIPPGKHAVFTHKGKLDKLQASMKFIYEKWLPGSGRRRRNAPDLEVYDERFNHESDQSEFDICIPIE